MAFKEDELNQLKLVINEAIKPFNDAIILQHQTLHDPDNGLCKRLRKIEEQTGELLSFKKIVLTVTTLVQGVGLAVIAWFKHN